MSAVAFVTRAFAHSFDSSVYVSALGLVPTGGWTDPRLDPRFYVHPPADGIWDFDFTATPPDDGATDVLTEIAASTLQPLPKWMRGARVHSANNCVVVKIVPGGFSSGTDG